MPISFSGNDKTHSKQNRSSSANLLIRGGKGFGEFLSRISKSRISLISIIILFFWLIMAIAGPLIVPNDPVAHNLADRFHPPSAKYLFGTDRYGRDTFSRIIVGSRTVFVLAASATAISLVLGTMIGLTSGYFGGLIDELVMRFMDIIMSFPALLIALMILGIFGPSSFGVIIVIGIAFAPRIARVARSATLDIKSKEFVNAARVRNESHLYIMLSEILPNIAGPLGVEVAVRFGYAIFTSASLGFLGLGVQPPTPDWGMMINEAQGYIKTAPWMVAFPAAAIASLTVSVNFLSDAIRKLESGDL